MIGSKKKRENHTAQQQRSISLLYFFSVSVCWWGFAIRVLRGGGGGRSSIPRFVGCGRKRRSSEAARTKGRPLIATASREKGKAEGDGT